VLSAETVLTFVTALVQAWPHQGMESDMQEVLATQRAPSSRRFGA
jgi:hypothetical protein